MKGKGSRSDLQVAVSGGENKVMGAESGKILCKVDPEKKFCAWLGLTKFKINLIKFA